MDRFVYNYHTLGGQPSNRLNYVTDNGTDYSSYDDIKSGQSTSNYTYNKIGELIEDASEDIELEWRYGDHKLLRVMRTDAASPNLEFHYNPFGQRVLKMAQIRSGGVTTGNLQLTFYAYDANGQVMAVYNYDLNEDEYKLNERHLYGAERLGVNSEEVVIYANNTFTPYTHKEEDVVHTEERGHKRYELSNHLGNVLATINDRKMWNATDGNYEAVVMSWADYYVGHALMPGRHGNIGTYRYGGANGQEKVDEVSGEGNHYTAEYWEYDSRLLRRWNQDPVVKHHESPYACFANNPIWFADPNGADTIDVVIKPSGDLDGAMQVDIIKVDQTDEDVLWVRYKYDGDDNYFYEGDDFIENTPEWHSAHSTETAYKDKNKIITNNDRGVLVENWKVWKSPDFGARYKTKGKEVKRGNEPNGRSYTWWEANVIKPPSYLLFEVKFNTDKTSLNNHSVENWDETSSVLSQIVNKSNSEGFVLRNGNLSPRRTGILIAGYHSPSAGSSTGNTKLAKLRAEVVYNYFKQKISNDLELKPVSGGELTQSAFIFIGIKELLNKINVLYNPPSIGE